jgi:hypothetical protein
VIVIENKPKEFPCIVLIKYSGDPHNPGVIEYLTQEIISELAITIGLK